MILEKLSNAIGVSGEEDEVRRPHNVAAIRDHVSDLQVDALGQRHRDPSAGQSSPNYSVMIAAHMDEIGMMVTAVEAKGLIQFTRVGGIDAAHSCRASASKSVSKRKPGVVLWKPIHLWRDMKTVLDRRAAHRCRRWRQKRRRTRRSHRF